MCSLRLCGEIPLLLLVFGFVFHAFSACGLPGQPKQAKNLLLVTIDTLRADRIGAYGWKNARTPNLDRLAGKGKVFLDVFTSVPVTLPSHATLFTGRLPFRHGVRNNSFYTLPKEEVTLAEVLQKAGYQTAAVLGSVVLDHRFGLDQGFEFYDDKIVEAGDSVKIAERSAQEVTRRAVHWLRNTDPSRPFFLWVHYFDPHAPYSPPPKFAGQTDSPYEDEIAYVDWQLGVLLQELKQAQREAGTLTVVTSDHGEGLGEHGEQSHGIFLYDSTLRVPLLITGPGIAPEVEKPSLPLGLVDLMPTLLSLLGQPLTEEMDGTNLFQPPLRRQYLYAETYMPRDFYGWSELQALRSLELKYVKSPVPELYDLRTDPRELKNLAAEDSHSVELLSAQLEKTAAASSEFAGVPETGEPDSNLLRQLRSLGYVGIARPVDESGDGHGQRPDPKERIHLVGEIDRALVQVQEGKLSEAVRQLQLILEVDPDNYVVIHTLADALFDLGRNREALQAYQQAMRVGPEAAYYHNRLALLYERLGEHEKAASHFLEVIWRNPEAAPKVLERVDSLLAQGNLPAAHAYLQALASAGIRGAALELRFADLWMRKGEIGKAVARLDQALAVDSGNVPLQQAKGRALRALGVQQGEQGNYAGAAATLQNALSYLPSDFETLYNLGITRLRMGEIQAGLQSLAQALEQRPNEIRILNLIAEVYLREGEYLHALTYLERSLGLDPEQPAVRHNWEAVKTKLGELPGG